MIFNEKLKAIKQKTCHDIKKDFLGSKENSVVNAFDGVCVCGMLLWSVFLL